MGATDQKNLLEQLEDSDFVPALTMSFKNKAEADAVAATFTPPANLRGV